MRVFTPNEMAKDKSKSRPATSKYLGVLVAARYARELNALPKDAVPGGSVDKKLTTQALETFTGGDIDFELVKRRRKSS
jgi:DNA-directed RNA polymerase omega subunit